MSTHLALVMQRRRQRGHRRDHKLCSARAVLAAMRAGAALHLRYVFGSPRWTLTDGRRVDGAAAAIIVAHPKIIGDNDALFADAPAQTYHYVSKGCAP